MAAFSRPSVQRIRDLQAEFAPCHHSISGGIHISVVFEPQHNHYDRPQYDAYKQARVPEPTDYRQEFHSPVAARNIITVVRACVCKTDEPLAAHA